MKIHALRLSLASSLLALTACAATATLPSDSSSPLTGTAPQAPVQTAPLPASAENATAQAPVWAFETSDLPLDPAFKVGRLDNGMRYIIRNNGTPAGQAKVQLYIGSGSLSERDEERGLAHFIEHMAFNGSTHVPEGEMVKLLEREGLAFGADTNASTGFESTVYKLDLPRNDPALLDTAMFLMRETASELLFDPAAVQREKGVILSERRVRDTYSFRNTVDRFRFLYPDALFPYRLPIGTKQVIENSTAQQLKALWQRLYTPENAAIVVVGDFDPAMVEAEITKHFTSWDGAPMPAKPDAGPVDLAHSGQTEIYLDPALPERITASVHGAWRDLDDTVATRQKNVLRAIGYGIINRRLQRLSRLETPPFRGAGFGTSDVFESGRTTNLVVDSNDGEWRPALAAAVAEYRRSMAQGFSASEVAEQLANLRTSLENAAAGEATRSNSAYIAEAIALLDDDRIPTTATSSLERFRAMEDMITPANIMAALREEALPLEQPLLRFQGNTAPAGGAKALRDAWEEDMAAPLSAETQATQSEFAYSDFGTPGDIVADSVEPLLGIRTLRFANGVKLNLKQTDLQQDRVLVKMRVDGGRMINTRENPLATGMVSVLPLGGLGKHSFDELQSILAGRSVGFSFSAEEEAFSMSATTTPRDLQLQLELMTAALTDPGYRSQGEAQYRRNIRNFFAAKTATPNSALSNALGGIVSDDDPRFTLAPEQSYLDLTFDKLARDIGDRLAEGAIEITLIGDIDEARAIDLVSRTLGALPPRETEFRPYADQRQRSFTQDRSLRTIYHDGEADQALLRMSWPTSDDKDFNQTIELELLQRVMRLKLIESLREELGQTYSPGVSASESGVYDDYGTFSIAAALDVADLDDAEEAMRETVQALIDKPVDADTLLRARQPMLEAYDKALKTNSGWMGLADEAQSDPEKLRRFTEAKNVASAITPEDIANVARRYLSAKPLEIRVIPRPEAATEPGNVASQ
ncbi:M16 family metallopeptidase [Altericroceibacterium endophyticum]|uniref:Insulinase family protein n=1 Tax=Altericroceibacterium endophyticum TaxID=1808508 RepID=A0A6I4T7W1_9SPHN|nr:M16 family metallopeptidase [Altericroceibacterium endophyticum]MXO66191.1 insulinase family protein [Altericroceibacterium endophyticum]